MNTLIEASGLRRGQPARHLSLRMCAQAIVFIFMAAPLGEAPQPGLDGSWALGVVHAASQGRVFGSEVLWTFGPLAWLVHPIHLGNIQEHIVVGRAIMSMLLFLPIALLISRSHNRAYILIVAATAAWASTLWIVEVVTVYAFVACLVCARWRDAPLTSGLSTSMAAALGMVALFVKFNIGALLLAALLIHVMHQLISRRDRRSVIEATLSSVVATLVAAIIMMSQSVDLASYLIHSARLSSGFSYSMANGHDRGAILASFVMMVLCISFAWTRRLHWESTTSLPVIFLLFKSAFVRQDAHLLYWFVGLPAVAPLVMLRSDRTAGRKEAALFLSLIAIAMIWSSSAFGSTIYPNPATQWGTNLKILSGDESIAMRRPSRLCSDIGHEYGLRINNETVDAYPWEISEVLGCGLTWEPRFVLQSYQNYTAITDRLTAARLHSDGPAFIIYRHTAIDDGHPMFAEPLTWRTVTELYKVDSIDYDTILLRRRSQQRTALRQACSTFTSVLGESWRVPADGALGVAGLDIRPSPFGKLMAFMYRGNRPTIRLHSQGGNREYSFNWENAANGLVVSHAPQWIHEVRSIFDGKLDELSRVESIVVDVNSPLWGQTYGVKYCAVHY